MISGCFLPSFLGQSDVLFHLQDLKVRDNQLQNQYTYVFKCLAQIYGTSINFYLVGVLHVDTESQFLDIMVEGKSIFVYV